MDGEDVVNSPGLPKEGAWRTALLQASRYAHDSEPKGKFPLILPRPGVHSGQGGNEIKLAAQIGTEPYTIAHRPGSESYLPVSVIPRDTPSYRFLGFTLSSVSGLLCACRTWDDVSHERALTRGSRREKRWA